MAGDWIRMRTNLRRHPKVIAMSRRLASDRRFMDWWSDPGRVTCRDSVTEIVTFENVTRVTVCGLLELWGSVNTVVKDDLVIPYMALIDIDDITGIPGFGGALEAVGWVREDDSDDVQGLVFPNFGEFNTPDANRKKAKSDAERAREYRARKRAETDRHETSQNVTKNHEKSRGEEKRREDIEQPPISPEDENQSGKRKRSAIGIQRYLDDCKRAGTPPISETSAAIRYADETGIPREFMRLCFFEFVERNQTSGKRYTDWPKAFLNCVRGGWYKLWWLDGEEYQLTSAGKQAQLKHSRRLNGSGSDGEGQEAAHG